MSEDPPHGLPHEEGRNSAEGKKEQSDLDLEQELDETFQDQPVLMGWSLPALFCTLSIIAYHIPLYWLVNYVETVPEAIIIEGEGLPWKSFYTTTVAFGTSLMHDFVTWLWTVDKRIARLFMFPTVIKWISFMGYSMLSNGLLPVLLDFKGRRLMVGRYLQWAATTPAMLYLYAILSGTRNEELLAAIILDELMLISGFFASYLEPPTNLLWLCASFGCFYFVICAINNMLLAAVDRCSPDDEKHRTALTWARLFMTATWSCLPLVWCLSAMDLISVTLEEQLNEAFDLLSKAAASSMLLYCSMQSQATKILFKQSMIIEQERENVAKAVQETSIHKERFLTAISHELRTPLNGIIGLAEGVLGGSCGFVGDKVKDRLRTIKISGHRLCSLVNDILDANSLKNEALELKEEWTSLKDVCIDLIDTIIINKKKTVELEGLIEDGIPDVWIDSARVKQMLSHVLGNALKFTEQGTVQFTVMMDKDRQNMVYTIQDSGIGIPEHQKDRIWGAFNQGDEGMARKHGGTGLGLTLAKQLVVAQGGTISCDSTVGVGTTFKMIIPIKRVEEMNLRSAEQDYSPRMMSLAPGAVSRFANGQTSAHEAGDHFQRADGNATRTGSGSKRSSLDSTSGAKLLSQAVSQAEALDSRKEVDNSSPEEEPYKLHSAHQPLGRGAPSQSAEADLEQHTRRHSTKSNGEVLSNRSSADLTSPLAGVPAGSAPDQNLEKYSHGTVVCYDVEGLTNLASANVKHVADTLEWITTKVSSLLLKHGMHRMRSFSSMSIVVAGAEGEGGSEHQQRAFRFAKDLLLSMNGEQAFTGTGEHLHLRIGVDCGPLSVRMHNGKVSWKHPYVFGEAVDVATLLASTAPVSSCHVSQALKDAIVAEGVEKYEWADLGRIRRPDRSFSSHIVKFGSGLGPEGLRSSPQGRRASSAEGLSDSAVEMLKPPFETLRLAESTQGHGVPVSDRVVKDERGLLQSSLTSPASPELKMAAGSSRPGSHGVNTAVAATVPGPTPMSPSIRKVSSPSGLRGTVDRTQGPSSSGTASSVPGMYNSSPQNSEELRVQKQQISELQAQVQSLEVLLEAERLEHALTKDLSESLSPSAPRGSRGSSTQWANGSLGAEGLRDWNPQHLAPLSHTQKMLLLLLQGEVENLGGLGTEVSILLSLLDLEDFIPRLHAEEVSTLAVLNQLGESVLVDVGIKSRLTRQRIVETSKSLSRTSQLFKAAGQRDSASQALKPSGFGAHRQFLSNADASSPPTPQPLRTHSAHSAPQPLSHSATQPLSHSPLQPASHSPAQPLSPYSPGFTSQRSPAQPLSTNSHWAAHSPPQPLSLSAPQPLTPGHSEGFSNGYSTTQPRAP